MRKLAKRYPLRSYFALAFTISWVSSLMAWGANFFRGESFELNDLFLVGMLMLAGPRRYSFGATFYKKS